jgi:hypothetical protein
VLRGRGRNSEDPDRQCRLAANASSSSGSPFGQRPRITRTARKLVDNDHGLTPALVDVVEVAGVAEQRIGSRHSVQGSLELISQIPIDHAAQDPPVRVREARITSSPPASAFLQQLLACTHIH